MSKWPSTGHHQRKKKQLLLRDGLVCYLCGGGFDSSELRIEHKLPRSRGGKDNLENLGLACSPCDGEKGDMTVEEYRAYLERNPPKDIPGARKIRHQLRQEVKGLAQTLGDVWPIEQES